MLICSGSVQRTLIIKKRGILIMKKKLIAMVVSIMCCAALLGGCGQAEGKQDNTTASSSEAEQQEETTKETTEETTKETTEETAEEKELTGTIDEIKDFMFVVTDAKDTPYSFTFDEKPEGLDNVSAGDTVIVKYTGTISEVDAFEGKVISVEKAN